MVWGGITNGSLRGTHDKRLKNPPLFGQLDYILCGDRDTNDEKKKKKDRDIWLGPRGVVLLGKTV